jgi:DNA-binding MarR family transcriptional regulator
MTIEKAIKQKKFANPYHKLLVNITYTANWFMNKQMELLRPFDLSPQQYNVLRILKGAYPEPMRVQDISDRMLDKTSNTSRLIDKLLSKKLVDKQLSRDDRRAVDILINPSGFDILEKTTPLIAELEKLMHGFTVEDVEKVNQVLDGIRNPE